MADWELKITARLRRPSNESFEMVHDNLLCLGCGKIIKRGIVTVSEHWLNCDKLTTPIDMSNKSLAERLIPHEDNNNLWYFKQQTEALKRMKSINK